MDTSRLIGFFATLAAVINLIGDINCGGNENDWNTLSDMRRFRDASEAINYMYEHLPISMSMEEKCKRYALLSSEALSEKLPQVSTVAHVSTMNKDDLDRHYNELHENRIDYAYMCAIDRYILTQLAPPFIELIDCFKQIDSPAARSYLENKELFIILDLYKQVLGQPGTVIDMKSLNSSEFRHPFCLMLKKLFRKYFDINAMLGETSSVPIGAETVTGPIVESSSLAKRGRPSRRTEQQLPAREVHRREQARLKQRRLRLAFPEVRERRRLYQVQRRKILKGTEPNLDDDGKRLEQERREQRNARRRLRYRQLQDKLFEEQGPLFAMPVDHIPKPRKKRQRLMERLPRLAPQQALSIPLTSAGQTLTQQVLPIIPPGPLSSTIISHSSFTQHKNHTGFPELLSLPPYPVRSIFFDQNNMQGLDRLRDDQVGASTSMGPETGLLIHHSEPQFQEDHGQSDFVADSDNIDTIMQFLFDEPQTSDANDDPFEAMSTKKDSSTPNQDGSTKKNE